MMHRYEKSGALSGLQRVREMTLNDGHTFVAVDPIRDEFAKILNLIMDVYKDFDITDYSFRPFMNERVRVGCVLHQHIVISLFQQVGSRCLFVIFQESLETCGYSCFLRDTRYPFFRREYTAAFTKAELS